MCTVSTHKEQNANRMWKTWRKGRAQHGSGHRISPSACSRNRTGKTGNGAAQRIWGFPGPALDQGTSEGNRKRGIPSERKPAGPSGSGQTDSQKAPGIAERRFAAYPEQTQETYMPHAIKDKRNRSEEKGKYRGGQTKAARVLGAALRTGSPSVRHGTVQQEPGLEPEATRAP